MYKKIALVTLMLTTLSTYAQSEKRGFYFKAGASYFAQTVATEFPSVSGQTATKEVTVNGQLVSKESITGSFGEGFRTNLVSGYRFTDRLGLEMGVHYYTSNAKTMVERQIVAGTASANVEASGKIRALDFSPALVLYLGEAKKFEPYTKVGVIVPVYGTLTIDTERQSTIVGVSNFTRKDVIKPNPTIGFMAALGTSYKLTGKVSVFAEMEYRNFTVHGKTKETTAYSVNGQDQLGTLPYAEVHTNYVDVLDTNSNNVSTNPSGYNTTKAKDELSSYVGISGIGLSLGIRYQL